MTKPYIQIIFTIKFNANSFPFTHACISRHVYCFVKQVTLLQGSRKHTALLPHILRIVQCGLKDLRTYWSFCWVRANFKSCKRYFQNSPLDSSLTKYKGWRYTYATNKEQINHKLCTKHLQYATITVKMKHRSICFLVWTARQLCQPNPYVVCFHQPPSITTTYRLQLCRTNYSDTRFDAHTSVIISVIYVK
jgi:hypothetical protein